MRPTIVLFALAAVSASPAAAQHEHAHTSPYVDLMDREVKALSQEEIDGLLAGEGIGFALAAELNGYPGPRHALDMADGLALSTAQRQRLEEIYASMLERAVAVGTAVLALERALDEAFATGIAVEDDVEARVREIASRRGELRAIHLTAHVATRALLTPEQRAHYAVMRGYAGSGG